MTAITESLINIHGLGVLASRPAPAVNGRQYFATDNLTMYEDSGTAWVTLFTIPTSFSLTVEEVDTSPTGPVTKIVFPNGTLNIASGVATYTPAASGMTNPMTAAGDLIGGGAAGNPIRVPAASASGYVLSSYLGSSPYMRWIEPPASAGGGVSSFGSLVFLEERPASASSQLDFTAITSNYDGYVFEIVNIIPANDNTHLLVRMSTNGGSTFDEGSNYEYSNYRIGGAGNGTDSSNGTTSIPIDEGSGTNGINNSVSLGGLSGRVALTNPLSTVSYKLLTGQTYCMNAFDDHPVTNVIGGTYKSTTAVNAIRFLMSSGNITSGTIRMYGIAKTSITGGTINVGADYDVSPNPTAYDDEFKSNTIDPAWVTLGTLNTKTTNTDRLSNLHIANTATGTFQVHGLYKPIPSMPFTVTMDLTEMQWDTNYQRTALMIAESTPGKLFLFGPAHQLAQNINMGYTGWTNRTTRASATDVSSDYRWQRYIRMVVTSSTSVTLQGSTDGYLWKTYATVNPGFTIGNFGIGLTGEDGSVVADAYVNWFRVGTNVIQPEAKIWQNVGGASNIPTYVNAVPEMTSATAPSGTASASESYATTPAWRAFATGIDGWITNASALPQWIKYQFPSSKTAIGYGFRPWYADNYPGRTPSAWKFQGSSDDTNWADLDSVSGFVTQSPYEDYMFKVDSPSSYQYYRLLISANNGNAYTGVGRFFIYTTDSIGSSPMFIGPTQKTFGYGV